MTEKVAYFRLHGIEGYYHTYSDAELEELRDPCASFADAYVLFNNVSMG